jgi:anti-sigma regulatory factor (Ser/Thr protein kinase)
VSLSLCWILAPGLTDVAPEAVIANAEFKLGSLGTRRGTLRNTVETLSISLPAEPRSASAARAWVREHCADLCHSTVCEDVTLVTSELFANACLHGRGPVQLSLVRGPGHVQLHVSDRGPGWGNGTVPDGPLPEDEHGRGLLIVNALSRAWGMTMRPEGHTVWAEFDCASHA